MRPRQGGTTRAGRRLTRWLLPLMLAAAVLAMHGLGHPAGHDGHMPSSLAASHPVAGQHGTQHLVPAPPPASGPALIIAGVTGPAEPGGLDPVAVCLAVLAGTMLLLLPLLRGRRFRSAACLAAACGRAGRYPAGRSPPPAPSLHALQVLRL